MIFINEIFRVIEHKPICSPFNILATLFATLFLVNSTHLYIWSNENSKWGKNECSRLMQYQSQKFHNLHRSCMLIHYIYSSSYLLYPVKLKIQTTLYIMFMKRNSRYLPYPSENSCPRNPPACLRWTRAAGSAK